MAYIQEETPSRAYWESYINFSDTPIHGKRSGSAFFGVLFEQFGELLWINIFLAIFLSVHKTGTTNISAKYVIFLHCGKSG